MEPGTRENGKKTSSMVKEWRHGLTVQNMTETMSMGRNTERESFDGLMILFIKVSLAITIFMEKECTPGPIRGSTMEIGSTIRWRAEEFSLGSTADDMRETIRMTRRKVSERLSGQMEEAIRDCGRTGNNMERESMCQVEVRRKKGSGRKARGSNGSQLPMRKVNIFTLD